MSDTERRACKWHSGMLDENCWACQRPRTEPVCYECGQHLNACHDRDEARSAVHELEEQVTALEGERNYLNRKLVAAEAERDNLRQELDGVLKMIGDTGGGPTYDELQQQLATARGLLREAINTMEDEGWFEEHIDSNWAQRAKKEVGSE